MPLGFFDESVDPLHWFDNDLSPGGWFDKDFFEAFGGEGGGGGESGGGGSSGGGGGGGTAPSGPLTTTRVSLPPGVRMTASLLKQIAEKCGTCNPCIGGSGSGSSGGGSGSGGGGGLTECCGCSSFPATLTASWDIGCAEVSSATLTKVSEVANCNTIGLVVSYTYEQIGDYVEGSYTNTDCFTGASSFLTEARETTSIILNCVRCVDGETVTHNWHLVASWNRIGVNTIKVTGVSKAISIVSCYPLVFATVEGPVVCEEEATSQSCCTISTPCVLEPYTPYTNCEGTSFTLDISE